MLDWNVSFNQYTLAFQSMMSVTICFIASYLASTRQACTHVHVIQLNKIIAQKKSRYTSFDMTIQLIEYIMYACVKSQYIVSTTKIQWIEKNVAHIAEITVTKFDKIGTIQVN